MQTASSFPFYGDFRLYFVGLAVCWLCRILYAKPGVALPPGVQGEVAARKGSRRGVR